MSTSLPTVLRIAVPTPLRKVFDYLAPLDLGAKVVKPGMRVRVSFHHRELVGIIVAIDVDASIDRKKLKQVIEIIDDFPILTQELQDLCHWAADYYHHPIGEVFEAALPALLRQGKAASRRVEPYWRVTPEGREIVSGQTSATPRQKAGLSLIAQQEAGFNRRQLKSLNITPALLKTLTQKQWLESYSGAYAVDELVITKDTPLVLNSAQQVALDALRTAEGFQVFLLDGVTGSGKTEVYLQQIANVIQQQKQVLVLVPEIGLTPQTLQRFRARFSVPIAAIHSSLGEKEKLNAWLAISTGEAKIVIGTRSAVFSPFQDLGLIIVDEEHDLSFKQQEGFRYHARDLAIMRAKALEISVVLGSATPSLETLARSSQGRYQTLSLPLRAGGAIPPTFSVLDIRQQPLEEGISTALLKAMHTHLDNGDQIMLFLNRRGFAPVFMCHSCGWTAICTRCDARLTYHQDPLRLHCHHCDSRRMLPKKCGQCQGSELHVLGLGTERLEHTLQKYFPSISIVRIDRDSTQRKGSMHDMLDKIQKGEHRILIGTQMLAKGHHFPNVTLVGIIDIDGGFFSADFRAIERTGQLILQVAGRAGRENKPGQVVLQTRHPDHPLLLELLHRDYRQFANSILQEREQAMLPPFAFFALFRAESYQADLAFDFLLRVKELMKAYPDALSVMGPVAAPMAKRAGRFRLQLILQAEKRPLLQHYLRLLLPEIDKLKMKKNVRWSLDIDPLEML